MQEFSSVTASSYDAESLAPLLNEKAADGWSVVSIVAAGTNIVAYLQRATDAGAVAEVDTGPEASASDEAPADEPAIDDAPAFDEAPADEDAPAVEDTPAVADEPAGWAAAPDEPTFEPEPTPEPEPVTAFEPEPEPEPEPTTEPAAEAAAVAESAVPAGWYADPSGRFELRYWDGTAWTEHVSRAGQQFTDPPVA